MDDVIRFKGDRKNPPDGKLMLVAPPATQCSHFGTSFEVDEKAGTCKCLGCGNIVAPIFVLMRLMNLESHWMRTRNAYQEEMKRLSERTRTKCQHCGAITRISKA